jgi:hypothetical protein
MDNIGRLGKLIGINIMGENEVKDGIKIAENSRVGYGYRVTEEQGETTRLTAKDLALLEIGDSVVAQHSGLNSSYIPAVVSKKTPKQITIKPEPRFVKLMSEMTFSLTTGKMIGDGGQHWSAGDWTLLRSDSQSKQKVENWLQERKKQRTIRLVQDASSSHEQLNKLPMEKLEAILKLLT